MWLDGDATVGPVSMPLLTSIGPMLEVNSVPSLSLPALTTVQGELDIGLAPGFAVDPRLTSLDLGSLQRATTLQVHAAAPLLAPHLMTASQTNLTGVTALDLSALQSGVLVLSSSTAPTLQLPSFVSGSIDVENNSALTSIALPAFAVGSELLVDQAPALQTVSAGSLTTLNGVYQITNAPALTTVTSPALATVTGNFSIYETSVTSLSYPNLRSVGSVLSIGSSTLPNPSLKTLAMPMLVQVGPTNSGTVEIRSSPQLPQCQADQINAHLVANGFFGFFTTSNLGTGTCP